MGSSRAKSGLIKNMRPEIRLNPKRKGFQKLPILAKEGDLILQQKEKKEKGKNRK